MQSRSYRSITRIGENNIIKKGFNAMAYTVEQKKRIEDILAAFKDYIDKNDNVDVVCSNKVGYVWIPIGEMERCMAHEIINEPGVLLLRLFSEIHYDIHSAAITDDETEHKLSDEEVNEIQHRINSYIEPMTDSKGYCEAYMEQFVHKLKEN